MVGGWVGGWVGGRGMYLQAVALELLGVGGSEDLVAVNGGVDDLGNAVAVGEADLGSGWVGGWVGGWIEEGGGWWRRMIWAMQ